MSYIEKLMAMMATLDLSKPEMYDTYVYHDDWCDHYKGKPCNCEPDIDIKIRKDK